MGAIYFIRVVLQLPLQGRATLLGMLRIGLSHLSQDGLLETPTADGCRIVDQLNAAQMVDLKRVYKGKRYHSSRMLRLKIRNLSRNSRKATDFAFGKVALLPTLKSGLLSSK